MSEKTHVGFNRVTNRCAGTVRFKKSGRLYTETGLLVRPLDEVHLRILVRLRNP